MEKLSLVMLFGDLGRFSAFARARLDEALGCGLFSEAIFVVNSNDIDTQTAVRDIALNLRGMFSLCFNQENNIPQGRNLGITMARSDSVFVWDDDDALINPLALGEAFQFFRKNNLPLMEVPMVFPDGRLFHPGGIEIMPQVGSGLVDLVLIGMMHSPFFLKKEVWEQVPMPEYVPLRGDWLHWSALLWNAGVPITCWTKSPVVMEGVRERDECATASGNGHEAKLQAYTSLISLFALYGRDLTGGDKESLVVKRRYFDRYGENNEVWQALVTAGQTLQSDTRCSCPDVAYAREIVRLRLTGVRFEKKALKPFQAVMEPGIAQAIFDKYRG